MQACSSSGAHEQAIYDTDYQGGNGYCESGELYEPDCHRRRISCDQDDQMQCDDYSGEAEYENDAGDFGLPALNNFITRISSTEIFDEPSVKAKFVGPYFVSARMGSGSYATVKKCVDSRTLQRFAIKILAYRKGRKIPTFEQDIRSEIRLLSRLNHPNVIRLFDILEKRKPEDFKKYLVLTYCIADMQHILENARGHKFPEYQAQR
jgi:serine/threonine protein kinase